MNRGCTWLFAIMSFAGACRSTRGVEVVRNPYAEIDWRTIHAYKTQLHEHAGDNPDALRRMDDAGYEILPLMHYSGVKGHGGAWHERHWPPERFLPEGFASELKHVKLFFPDAEEVGYFHMTSPFLTTYIERQPKHGEREPWQYGSTQEAIDLIRSHGGLAFLAHPWSKPQRYAVLHGFTGIELYNAFCRGKFEAHKLSHDCSESLLRSFDRVLYDNPATVGIAVNDWFGPATAPEDVAPATLDSGKVVVLLPAPSLAGLRHALERGALFAVKDLGVVKDRFPRVRAIRVDRTAIRIELATPARVRWILDGHESDIHEPALPLARVPPQTHYARAEIVGKDASTVYTEAFALGVPGGAGQRARALGACSLHTQRTAGTPSSFASLTTFQYN